MLQYMISAIPICVFVFQYRGRITSLVSWDSSMHDSALLNKVTSSGERIFIIVKVRKLMVTYLCPFLCFSSY